MKINVLPPASLSKNDYSILIVNKNTKIPKEAFTSEEINYLNLKSEDESQVSINKYSSIHYIYLNKVLEGDSISAGYKTREAARKTGAKIYASLNSNKTAKVYIKNETGNESLSLAMAEGIYLASYKFNKYLKDKEKRTNRLKEIIIYSSSIKQTEADALMTICSYVLKARDLVNEPVNYLNAVKFGEEFETMSVETGFTAKILNKNKIEELGMGGLLAVNKGSIDPPTFSILEWKPIKTINKKPIVLIGKGVVYDTGGISLKPTPDSMDSMKCDMAGGAAVACAIAIIAKLKLPLHIISLIPATDNRPDAHAFVPGDIIYMHNGASVEVLNTDAEGRLLLADALSFAKQYDPELVIDVATLTGAAANAIGPLGLVAMCNDDARNEMELLKISGNNVYERIVEFPFWDEYFDLVKSDIADLKNIGGKYAGAITAGKFLEKFTDYPYIHLDIAGPAFINADSGYLTKGGTGYAIRLLIDFLINKAKVQ